MLFVILISLITLIHGSPVSRIVGGRPTDIKEAPHQVALLLDYWSVGVFNQYCGGAIINRRTILTAAHCLDETQVNQWKIRAGSTLHNSGGQVIEVNRFTQHPLFNNKLDNDVALMFLTYQLLLGPTVASINLPLQGYIVPDDASAFITGWGALTDGGSSSIQLYIVNLNIVNQESCKSAYSEFHPVTSNMICAGRDGGGADACQGDSGAPMIISGVLQGLASWGDGCGKPDRPGVYARVASFRNWINSYV